MGLDARDIARMSPQAQAQVFSKIKAKQRQKENKYHNEQTVVRGIRFDSKKEANRYEELMLMLKAGKIRKLKLQQDFTLQEAFTDTEGKRVRAIRYKADFTYYQPPNRQLYGSHAPYYAEQSGVPWEFVVEDVKGVRTEKYKLKKKLMLERFGITIREV